ncbi:hypothetical protein H8959_000054, partial [Pygathrix nigripes]
GRMWGLTLCWWRWRGPDRQPQRSSPHVCPENPGEAQVVISLPSRRAAPGETGLGAKHGRVALHFRKGQALSGPRALSVRLGPGHAREEPDRQSPQAGAQESGRSPASPDRPTGRSRQSSRWHRSRGPDLSTDPVFCWGRDRKCLPRSTAREGRRASGTASSKC